MDETKEAKTPVTLVLPASILERVDALAAKENRSRTGQVKQLLNEALDARKKEP